MAVARKVAKKAKKPAKKKPAKKKPAKKKPAKKKPAKKKPAKNAVKKKTAKKPAKLTSTAADKKLIAVRKAIKEAAASCRTAAWYDGMVSIDFVSDILKTLEKKVK